MHPRTKSCARFVNKPFYQHGRSSFEMFQTAETFHLITTINYYLGKRHRLLGSTTDHAHTVIDTSHPLLAATSLDRLCLETVSPWRKKFSRFAVAKIRFFSLCRAFAHTRTLHLRRGYPTFLCTSRDPAAVSRNCPAELTNLTARVTVPLNPGP